MHLLPTLVLGALVLTIHAGPIHKKPRQGTSLTSLPASDPDPVGRAAGVANKKAGYQYAPSLLGNGSFFLGGTLGDARVQSDIQLAVVDQTTQNNAIAIDAAAVQAAVQAAGGLTTLASYTEVLYKNQWNNSVPKDEAPGALTNYTQDLFFSMERLSLNPYPLRRIGFFDTLPFAVDAAIVSEVTGLWINLNVIKYLGRLFVVDHSNQAIYAHSTDKFGGAAIAYFYIALNGDFLPLAIKPSPSSDLIYTRLDTAQDWLLAKMIFNVNDLFHAEAFHLTAFHDVGEIIHEAALRTLSDNHPVFVFLDRLMYMAYSVRPIGEARLFNPGGKFDATFYINSVGIKQYATDQYPAIGAIKGKYLETDLAARGLINQLLGPSFKTFPFYEDISATKAIVKTFITDFVNSYYLSDALMKSDIELNAWFLEASTTAQAIDFPCSPSKPCGRADLIDLLVHVAHMTGITHHVLNTGDLTLSLGVLPFHPAALYQPLPTTKLITSVVPFLPPIAQALGQVTLMAAFNRPLYEAQHKTLAWAYNDPGFLGRFNAKVGTAAAKYQTDMLAFSAKVRARVFDKNGLCQGMPFIWRGVDPGTIPWFFAI